MTGGPGAKPISKPKHITEFEKAWYEATEEGKDAVLCIRYYLPDSPLSNSLGWVDITIRRTVEDAERAVKLRDQEEHIEVLSADIATLEASEYDLLEEMNR